VIYVYLDRIGARVGKRGVAGHVRPAT
jgi:hypothetical protein